LGYNSLLGSDEGAASLASALRALTGLQELNLFSNNLRPEGAATLAPALKALTGLSRLELGDNDVRARGAGALAPALMVLTGLRQLGLEGNELGARSIAILAPVLTAMTRLEDFVIYDEISEIMVRRWKFRFEDGSLSTSLLYSSCSNKCSLANTSS
jgi:Ran GTPase-activating protein (RanGAP) involved in mRNA processing and transport